MEGVLWYMLTGARGGPTRIRILEALDSRPWNAHQLAEELDLDYTTVRYHLDVLQEHDLVKNSTDGYGAMYTLSDAVKANWTTVEEIIQEVQDE
ncbi:MAG: ArsR/SmtB family transcription factor [Haloarculaceae archaeon]